MGKNKGDIYLPLYWTKSLAEQADILDGIPPEYVRVMCESHSSKEERRTVLSENPNLASLTAYIGGIEDDARRNDILCDIDAISLTMIWAKNKQVFKFDADFLNELVNTRTVTMSENSWDYLPYDTFYIDISDNPDICNRILGKGLFIRVEKAETANIDRETKRREMLHGTVAYAVHVVKVTENLYFRDFLAFDNEDSETDVNDWNLQTSVQVYESKGDTVDSSIESLDRKLYRILIAQLLTYLSSVEPDVGENDNTKRTYRKPAPGTQPKNKFSEIQQWDVGIRFGSSFRKWKMECSSKGSVTREKADRAKMRPHSRRAHWSHYWYGSGDNKERRPKWVAAYFVNSDGAEQDTVIHMVKDS